MFSALEPGFTPFGHLVRVMKCFGPPRGVIMQDGPIPLNIVLGNEQDMFTIMSFLHLEHEPNEEPTGCVTLPLRQSQMC